MPRWIDLCHLRLTSTNAAPSHSDAWLLLSGSQSKHRSNLQNFRSRRGFSFRICRSDKTAQLAWLQSLEHWSTLARKHPKSSVIKPTASVDFAKNTDSKSPSSTCDLECTSIAFLDHRNILTYCWLPDRRLIGLQFCSDP